MLKSEPKTLSAALGVSEKAVYEAGAVNITLNCDTKLFIDPLLLSESKYSEFSKCSTLHYKERFELVIKLLEQSHAIDDKAWKAARKQLSFPEMASTHLGYSSGKNGSGFGKGLTDTLLASAKEVIDIGVRDPDLFMALALFEDNVGADRISDMTSHIILPCLIGFTREVAHTLGIPLKEFHLAALGIKVELPANPLNNGSPLILVPHDVVRDLPVASDWSSVSAAAQENQDLRDRVNEQIGDIWSAKTRKQKRQVRDNLLASKEGFETFLEILNLAAKEPYDVQVDHNGELYPSDLREEVLQHFPVDLEEFSNRVLSESEAMEIVSVIIGKFTQLIENNGLWRLLWNEELDKPRHEKAAQQVFFAIAISYCQANNLDLTPEANAGSGPVDFKFSQGSSKKILVELKKSTNSALIGGYSSQLEIYKESEETKLAHYVVIDVGSLTSLKKQALSKLHDAAAEDGHPSKIWYVDGTTKAPASKA